MVIKSKTRASPDTARTSTSSYLDGEEGSAIGVDKTGLPLMLSEVAAACVVWAVSFFVAADLFNRREQLLPARALALRWLLIGGLAYTGGIFFFAFRRMPYSHAVWHLFVLAGSICHFFAITLYVLPGR